MKANAYPVVDAMRFLVDDEIRPFEIDQRFDLTGIGKQACPTIAQNVFVVHQHVVPENTAEVVMNVFGHCWERTNVPNSANESCAVIAPSRIQGFVLFDNSKSNNQPYIVEHDYNAPTINGKGNNTNRTTLRGSTWLSIDQPLLRNAGEYNTLTGIYLPPNSIFRVIFRLAPTVAAGTPAFGIPNPFKIGGPAGTVNRIDFAGAMVSGVRMPTELYDKLKTARRKGQLGPEGSSGLAPIGGAGRGILP